MENKKMLSKTIGLQKTAFTNTLAIISSMQQHGEDLLKTTLEQSPWLPESSKDACLYWADCYSKYLENFKSVADQGFAAIELISLPGTKPEENEPLQTVTKERVPAPRPAKKSPTVRKKTVSAKKAVGAKTLPGKKAVARNIPAQKPVPREKLEVKKPEEIKPATYIPKPSVTSQSTASSASGEKESAGNPLAKKG